MILIIVIKWRAMVLCICRALTERLLEELVRDGARTLDEVADASGAGTDCGACVDEIEERLGQLKPAACSRQCASCPGRGQ